MKQISREDFTGILAEAIDKCMNKASEAGCNAAMSVLMIGTLVGIEVKQMLFEEDDKVEIVDKED